MDPTAARAKAHADAAYLDSFTDYVQYELWVPDGQVKKRDAKGAQNTSALLKAGAPNNTRKKQKGKGQNMSRDELRQKLHSRIDELKEKQREEQSERDKARKLEPGSPKRLELREKLDAQIRSAEAKRGKKADKRPLDIGNIEVGQKAADLTAAELSANAPGTKKRRLQELLKEEQAAKQRLVGLPEAELKAAKQAQEMQKALVRAGGDRVYDESQKLKKALKAIGAKKDATKKKWDDRKEDVSQKMKEANEKRNDNLKNKRSRGKKEDKKGKGDGKGKGKGGAKPAPEKEKLRAGFEGKRKGFLNSM